MLENVNLMVFCSSCKVWFHGSCESSDFEDSEWVCTRCNKKQNMAKFRNEKNEGVQTGRMRTKKFAEWRRCYRINRLGRL